jgi:citrate lyase synthetase
MDNIKGIDNFVNEKKVTVKRRYTEAYPAKNVSTAARVRNTILDAVSDGHITEEEMSKILTELKAHKRWLNRNKTLFNISEDQAGIKTFSLSPYGVRIKNATRPTVINEALSVPHKDRGGKPVNIFVGRFQPFTLGHVKVFEKMYKENGYPVVVYLVRGGKADPEKRPFDEDLQQAMFAKMAKQYPFLETAVVVPNGAIDTLFSNARPTYEPMMWGFGSDRKNAYNSMIDKKAYREQLGVDPNFKGYEIKRTDDNISASKVRNALERDDEKTFKKMTPKSIHSFYKTLQNTLQPIKENNKMDNLKTLNEFNSKITEGNLNEGLDPYQILYIFKSLIEKGGSVGVTQKGEWEKRGTHVPTAEEIKEVALKHLKYKRINRSVIDDVIDEWEVFKKDEKLDKLYKKKSSWVKNDIKESNLNEGSFDRTITTKITYGGSMFKERAHEGGTNELDIAEMMADDIGLVSGHMEWTSKKLHIVGKNAKGEDIKVLQTGEFDMYGGPYTPKMGNFAVTIGGKNMARHIDSAFKNYGWGDAPDLGRTDIWAV